MKLIFMGDEIPCARAERTADGVRAWNGAGELVFQAIKVSDFSAFGLEDGAWSQPAPTAEEDMDAMLVDHEYRLTLLELGVTEEV